MVHVALLAEGVDRNMNAIVKQMAAAVALLAEGVDRNALVNVAVKQLQVALLAEGVDRNKANEVLTEYRSGRPPRGGRG